MSDKNNTTEDNAACVGKKKIPIEDSVSYSQNNPAEDHAAMGPIYTSPLTILAN
jgi:hypothetical protein